MARLHLIRHGRASASADDYDQLQSLGEEQARLLGAHLGARGQRFDHVFVGPHRRQQETLALMRETASEHGISWPEAAMLPGLEEAPYEPLLKQHLQPRLATDAELRLHVEAIGTAADRAARHDAMNRMFDHMVQLWRSGEVASELTSFADFEGAVMGAYDRIRAASQPGEEVAVVTSNGVIGSILDRTVGLELPEGHGTLKLANTSVCVLQLEGEAVRLLAHNATEHLTKPEQVTIL